MFPTWAQCKPNRNKRMKDCKTLDYNSCRNIAAADCMENSCLYFAVGNDQNTRNVDGYFTYADTDCVEVSLSNDKQWDFYTNDQRMILLFIMS